MSFDKLIHKVAQAENALEAHERRVASDLRQMRDSWKALWTPGRIVVAGLVSGFMAGRAEPLGGAARSGSVVRIVSMLTSMFASTTASHAAAEAEQAAETSGDVAAAVVPGASAASDVRAAEAAAASERLAHERLLRQAAAARGVDSEAVEP